MLELIIALLKLTFENKKYTSKVYGLAEIVERDAKKFPAGYQSKDNYGQINLEDSAIYFRKTGNMTQVQNPDEGESGCDEMVTINYPLTAVAYIPKSIFNTDNAFIDDKVSRNIANLIENASYEQLRVAMKADDLRCVIKSVSSDRYEIWKREYTGIEMAARHDHVLCAVNFDIEIKINSSCLANFECDDIAVDIVDDEIVVSIRDNNAWHRTGDEIGADAELGSTNNYGFYIIVNGVRYWLINTSGDIVPQQPNSNIGTAVAPVTDGYFGTLHYTTLDPAIPAATWPNVLASGNTTGGNDAIWTTGDVLKSDAGGGQIDLGSGVVALTTDFGGFSTPYIFASQTAVTLASLGGGEIDLLAAKIQAVHGTEIYIDAPTLSLGTINAVTVNLATGAANTLVNIGTSGNNVITIGNTLSTINLIGTVINQNVVNLNVKDKLITLNDGGAVGSGSGVGVEVEENAVATGYFKTTGGRDGWLLKAPANSFESSFLFAPSAARSYTWPDTSGTVGILPIVLTTDVSGILPVANGGTGHAFGLSATSPIFYNSGTGVISSQAASATLEGYVTTGTQTFAGNKTFTSQVTISNFSGGFSVNNAGQIIIPNNGGPTPSTRISAGAGWTMNSGSATIAGFDFYPSINQSGGTSVTTGVNIAPSITAAVDFRSFNSSLGTNAHWGIYSSGSASKNYFEGVVAIGTTTTTLAKLTVVGSTRFDGLNTAVQGIIRNITSTAISYGVLTTDHTVKVTASGVTITLETAVGNTGQIHFIKNASSGTITLTTTSSQTIFLTSALTSYTLNAGDSYGVQSDGANWIVI